MADRRSLYVNADMPVFVSIASFGDSPISASPPSPNSIIDWISDSDSDSQSIVSVQSPIPSPSVSPVPEAQPRSATPNSIENVSLIGILTRAASRRMATASLSPAALEGKVQLSASPSIAAFNSATNMHDPVTPLVPAESLTNSQGNSHTSPPEAQIVADLLNFSIQELAPTLSENPTAQEDAPSVNKEDVPPVYNLHPYHWLANIRGSCDVPLDSSPTPRPVGLPPKTFSNGTSSSQVNHDHDRTHGLPTPDTATSSPEVETPVSARSPFDAAFDDDSRTSSPAPSPTGPQPIIQAFAWRESIDGTPPQSRTGPFIPSYSPHRFFTPDSSRSTPSTECLTPVVPASRASTFGRPPQVHFALTSPVITSCRSPNPYCPPTPPAPPRRKLPERPAGNPPPVGKSPRNYNHNNPICGRSSPFNWDLDDSLSWDRFNRTSAASNVFVPPGTGGSASSRSRVRSPPIPRFPPPPAPPHPTSCNPLPPISIPNYTGGTSERPCSLPDSYFTSPRVWGPQRQNTDATFGSPPYLPADSWVNPTYPSMLHGPPYRYIPPPAWNLSNWGQPSPFAPPLPSYALPQTHPRFSFSDGTVTFSVQHKDYRVHRYFFEQHSSFFKEMLSSFPLNYSDPIVLSASQIDFERLLAVFYPANLAETELATVEEWTSVLTLATMWDFKQLRTRAIKELAAITSPVERIILARQHNVKEWPLSAYKELCLRGRALSVEEGELLGMKTVIKIWETETELRAQCKGQCCEQKVTTVLKAKFGLT